MAEDKNGRSKAIDMALGQIEKQFGKGSIMKLGDKEISRIPAIPTGSISIDSALGIGGVPRGRVSLVRPREARLSFVTSPIATPRTAPGTRAD